MGLGLEEAGSTFFEGTATEGEAVEEAGEECTEVAATATGAAAFFNEEAGVEETAGTFLEGPAAGRGAEVFEGVAGAEE